MREESFVYIVCHNRNGVPTGPVKIGVANNPHSRVRELAVGNPNKIELFQKFELPNREIAFALEKAFHTVYAKNRRQGEWFSISPRKAFMSMCANLLAHMKWMGFSEEDSLDGLSISIRQQRPR